MNKKYLIKRLYVSPDGRIQSVILIFIQVDDTKVLLFYKKYKFKYIFLQEACIFSIVYSNFNAA